MPIPKLDPTLLIQAFGLTFVALGAAAWVGAWKKWYWRTRGTVYSYIPLGLLFLAYSFHTVATQRLGTYAWAYYGLYAVLVLLGAWFSFRAPAFIKPAWVRWVEAHPAAVRKAMEEDTKEDPLWFRHVTSKPAVALWAREMGKKAGLKSSPGKKHPAPAAGKKSG